MFFSSAREKFSPEISVFAEKKQFAEVNFFPNRPNFDFYRRRKEESRRFFHLTTDGAISKRGRFCPNTSTRTKKHKAITEKPKDKIKKQTYYRKDQAQTSKTSWFSSPPPLRSKNTSRLSLQTSPLFATSSLVSSQTSPPRTKSHSILRAGHAPTRIYTLALSANLPFLPSPFTLAYNKLYISRLSVKANPSFTFTATS